MHALLSLALAALLAAPTAAPPDDEEDRSAYALPLFGAEAIRAGADLPLPVGITVLGQYQREDVSVHNLQVGLGGAPLVNADFVRFNGITTRARNFLARGDVWLLPFFNLYGVAGETFSTTNVALTRPISFLTTQTTQGATLGFGGTLAYGIEPYGFITLDSNLTWSDQNILSSPQRVWTVTPRLGHRFRSQTTKGRALSLWLGANMEEFEGHTVGAVSLGGVFPGSGSSSIPLPSDFGTWFSTLTPTQQQAVGTLLSQLISLQQTPGTANGNAQFDLVLHARKAWNLVVGGEMDLNAHWQFIGEAGFLGARTSVIGNLCYRFGI